MKSEKYVCICCVPDEGLASFVQENGEQRPCDYCGSDGELVGSVEVHRLAEHIRLILLEEYGDVDSESVSYDNEEGRYYCETYDTYDLLVEQVEISADDAVIADLVAILPDDTWCKRHSPASGLAAALRSGWDVFSNLVKYNTRYLLLDPPDFESEDQSFSPHRPYSEVFGFGHDGEEGVPPSRMLFALGSVMSQGPSGLMRVIQPHTVIIRARVHSADENPSTAADLGPPTRDKASQSNRMSPAGIVMFYGAFDRNTAILETFDPCRNDAHTRAITTAAFHVQRALTVLDLTDLPKPPSFFGSRDLHYGVRFLHEFEKNLVKPIERDDREHIEYVPSQIVAEYIRYRFRPENQDRLDGIVYRSSKTDKPACALFLDRSDCGADDAFAARPPVLQLDDASIVRISGGDWISGRRATG